MYARGANVAGLNIVGQAEGCVMDELAAYILLLNIFANVKFEIVLEVRLSFVESRALTSGRVAKIDERAKLLDAAIYFHGDRCAYAHYWDLYYRRPWGHLVLGDR